MNEYEPGASVDGELEAWTWSGLAFAVAVTLNVTDTVVLLLPESVTVATASSVP